MGDLLRWLIWPHGVVIVGEYGIQCRKRASLLILHHHTLGAKGHLPRGYIEDILRFFKQFAQKVSRGYMLGSFTMYLPL